MAAVLVTGGTGFIGAPLVAGMRATGHQVMVLSRRPAAVQGAEALASLEQLPAATRIDAIINLAGAPIDRRWSEAYKQQLRSSRIETTRALVELVARLEHKPAVLVSASAIGWYGAQDGARALDESSPPQDEFTHRLCAEWEAVAQQAGAHGVRVCIGRFGVVLERDGGALRKMLPAFRLGLGGRLGDGRQMFSWIHREDLLAAINRLVDDPSLSGVFNLTAPQPVSNADFSRTLAATLRRPALLPMPAIVIRLLFGEMGDRLLLHGQQVLPARLQAAGFGFRYPRLEQALQAIFHR